MSSSTSTAFIFALLALLFISTTTAHSQMRCAKYDLITGECHAPIRNANVSYLQEANDMTTSGTVCQSPMANPISDAYANGAGCPDYAPCPAPMGTFAQGETFTITWLARNHAELDQTPGNIQLFLSPVESMTQGSDLSANVLAQTSICEAPFMSCGGSNGNFVECWTNCTMPATAAVGIHTLWWEWVWDEPSTYNVYTTCADIYVTASGSSTPVAAPSSAPSTTGHAQVQPSTTAHAQPSTTAQPQPSTTAAVQPATTARVAAPSTTGHAQVQPSTTAHAQPSTTASAPSSATTSRAATVPSTTAAPSSSTPCVSGHMRCAATSTYQTCEYGSWAAPQSCQAGLICSPSGDYIYCL